MNGQFYVYAHRRLDNDQVFYVGKGKGRRAQQTQSRNRWWKFIASKHGFRVELLHRDLTEDEAFKLERVEIARFGRGILCNNSDGGEGPAGAKHSEEARRRKRAVTRSIWDQSPKRKTDIGKAFRARWQDPVYRERVVSAQKQAQQLEAVRQRKVMAMRKAHSRPVRCLETGTDFATIADAIDWLKADHCKAKAVSCSISYAASGKRPSAYGYRWEYI